MPDITLCHGGSCPITEECFRAMAKPDPFRQSYFAEPPFKDGKCDHFYPYLKYVEDEPAEKAPVTLTAK